MKRAIALLLVLTALGAAGLVYTHMGVSASAEAVEMRETVISGDRAVAEGVEVHFPMECRTRLYWDTTLRVGAENETQTYFRLSNAEHRNWGQEPLLSLGVSDNVSGETLPSPEHELYAVVSDVASRVHSGTSGGESVRLRDYYEYMPLYVSVLVDVTARETGLRGKAEFEGQYDSVLEQRICELLAIPVPEDYYLNVNVEKDTAGDVLQWSVYPQREEQVLQFEREMACTEQGSWVAAHLSGGDGQFSCEGTDKLWYIPANGAESICVMGLDPGEEVWSLEADALGRAFAVIRRDGGYYIKVADSGDIGHVQTLSLPELGDEDWVGGVYGGENCVLVRIIVGGVTVRFEMFALTESGEYVPCLSGELCDPGRNTVYSSGGLVLRWDGHRLAIAAATAGSEQSTARQGMGFMLWVFDGGGGSFCARYDSSLAMAEPLGYIVEYRKERELSLH